MGKFTDELGRMVSDAQFNKRVKQLSKEQEKKEKKENQEYEARVNRIKKEMKQNQEKEVHGKKALDTLQATAIDAKWAIQDAGMEIVDKVKDVVDYIDEVTLPKRIEKKLEKEEKQQRKEQLKKATKLYFEETSEDMHRYIIEKAQSEVDRWKLISCAVNANYWLAYALYYMTNPEAEIIDVSNEEGTFVNAIANYFSFGSIFRNLPTGNIMDYDISTEGKNGFLLSVQELEKKMDDEVIRMKFLQRNNFEIKSTEQEKRKKQERRGYIKSLSDVLTWTPFCKYSIIGFRRLIVHDYEIYLDCLELIDEMGKHHYIYHNKQSYKGGHGGYLGYTMSYPYPSEAQFTYSPKSLEELTSVLELIIPKFASLSYEAKEPRDIYSRIKEVLEQDFTLKNHGMGSNILCEDELELLSDDMLIDFCEKCKGWKDGSYSQYFEPKAYETWRNRLESIGVAAEKEWINRAAKQEQAKQEAQKQKEAQLREEELKGKQEAGNAGEQEVEYQLKWLPKEYMAVEKKTSGILLAHPDFDNEKQEIDHIVLGPQGVFLIETKAYSGTIRIDAQGNWTRSKGDGIEEGLRNPVAQVNRHHLVVEKILGISEIYDIICIANDKSIIEGAENSVVPVVKSDMLGHYISNYKKDSDKRYNEEEVKELKAKLESSMLENEA